MPKSEVFQEDQEHLQGMLTEGRSLALVRSAAVLGKGSVAKPARICSSAQVLHRLCCLGDARLPARLDQNLSKSPMRFTERPLPHQPSGKPPSASLDGFTHSSRRILMGYPRLVVIV